MRLVVDTSVLVGELLRAHGRERLGDDRLELFLPEQMRREMQVELPRRIGAFVRHRQLDRSVGDRLASLSLKAVETNLVIIEEAVYSALEGEARARSLRGPRDWPVVASAIALSAGVWTNDNDFLGTGVPTWMTERFSGGWTAMSTCSRGCHRRRRSRPSIRRCGWPASGGRSVSGRCQPHRR